MTIQDLFTEITSDFLIEVEGSQLLISNNAVHAELGYIAYRDQLRWIFKKGKICKLSQFLLDVAI